MIMLKIKLQIGIKSLIKEKKKVPERKMKIKRIIIDRGTFVLGIEMSALEKGIGHVERG
mgnify:CR=1 FL=1